MKKAEMTVSSSLRKLPGSEEARPEREPMAPMDRFDTICPADLTNWLFSSSKPDSRGRSMCSKSCSNWSKLSTNAGST